MTVIAMSFEIGTRSRKIAAIVAARLGLEVADVDYLRDRIADRFALRRERFGSLSRSSCPFRSALEIDDLELARIAEEEIRELAAYGNILLQGWGGPLFLRDNPCVVRVRIRASLKYRLAVLAGRHPRSSKAALLRMITESDACLSSNLEPVLGLAWAAPNLYHLSIDADALGAVEAARKIECFVRSEWARPARPHSRLPTSDRRAGLIDG